MQMDREWFSPAVYTYICKYEALPNGIYLKIPPPLIWTPKRFSSIYSFKQWFRKEEKMAPDRNKQFLKVGLQLTVALYCFMDEAKTLWSILIALPLPK